MKTHQLSRVPLYARTDITLPDQSVVAAGNVAWMSPDEARSCEDRRLGTVLAACSVLKPCRAPNGGLVLSDAQIAAFPSEHAERLEREGFVRVLRTDADVEAHRDGWRRHTEQTKALVAKARELQRQSDEAAREASRASRLPTFSWDEPAKKAS